MLADRLTVFPALFLNTDISNDLSPEIIRVIEELYETGID